MLAGMGMGTGVQSLGAAFRDVETRVETPHSMCWTTWATQCSRSGVWIDTGVSGSPKKNTRATSPHTFGEKIY